MATTEQQLAGTAKGALAGASMGAIGGPVGMAAGGAIGGALGWLGSRGGPNVPDMSPEESEQARIAQQYYQDILSGKDEVGRAAMQRGMETSRMQSAGMLGSARGMTPQQASLMASQQQLAGASQAQGSYQDVLERARSGAAGQMSQMGMSREQMEMQAAIEQQRIMAEREASSRQMKGAVIGGLGEIGAQYAPEIGAFAKDAWAPYM